MNTLLQFPRGLGKNVIYSIGSFVSAIATVVLNILFIAVLKWGAYGMFTATMIGKIVTIVYLFVAMKAWKYISLRSADLVVFKNVSKYSLPLVPNQLSWWVIGASDRTVVSNFISVAANGIYSVANKFSTVYVTFYNIFNLSWTESVSLHMNDEDRDVFLTDIINTMFNLFASVDIGIIVCMPFLFKLGFINSQYDAAYYQIPILMVAVLFQVVVGLYSVVYVALKKSKEIAKTSLFAAIINLTVDLALIRLIGLYAASVSTLVAYAAMAIYRYIDAQKYVNVRFKINSLLITTIVGAFAIAMYYTRNISANIVALLIVVIYAITINKRFLISTTRSIVNKIKSLKH